VSARCERDGVIAFVGSVEGIGVGAPDNWTCGGGGGGEVGADGWWHFECGLVL
jgi:hypothetical protein